MYEELIKQLKQFNAYQEVDKYIVKNENTILNLVKERLKKGDGVNGGTIGEYASLEYSYFKQRLNPFAGGYVDLYLTGSLQKAMEIREEASGVYLIHSTDRKYFKLAEKYGEEQFGLTNEQMESVKNKTFEEVINKINQYYE